MRPLSIGFIVDHPKRDLPSGVSLARALVERGCDAYLIPLYEQAVDVPLLGLDGIIVNFARPANLDLVQGYADAQLAVFVLDTEGGNQTEAGTNTPERLGEILKERGFSDCLSGYFFWGPKLRDAFVGRSGMPEEALVTTGCPRFDYASARWRTVLDYPKNDYVLVNANYPLVNPRFATSEAREREAAVQAGWDAEYMRRMVADMGQVFTEFIRTIARLSSDLPSVRFIVRPHPFEDHGPYARAFAESSNVEVDGTGPVLNVLAHARCLVHLNCATAVEATMLERLPISIEYLNTPTLLGHAPLPSRISKHARSYEELVDLVSRASLHATTFPFQDYYKEWIYPWFYLNDGRSADRIADFVLAHVTRRGRPFSILRSLECSRRSPRGMQRAQALLANVVGSRASATLRAMIDPVRRDKVFTPEDVARAISHLCRAEGLPGPSILQARHPITGVPLSSVLCRAAAS